MNKKLIRKIITAIIVLIFTALLCTVHDPRDYASAAVKGITKDNYLTYEKPNRDPRDGYNKGDANARSNEYMDGEEIFYNEYYDHWNVDEVYDEETVRKARTATKEVKKAKAKKSNKQLVKTFCRKHYGNKKIKYVKNPSYKRLTHRKGKILVEIVKSKSCGRYGYDKDGGYIRYNKRVKKGKTVTSYLIYNPKNNAIDDIVAVVDNNKIR